MTKREKLFAAALGASLVLGPLGSPALAQSGEPTLTDRQRHALDRLEGRLSYIDFERSAVPAWLMGDLGPAPGEPAVAALAVIRGVGDIFRLTQDDDFRVRLTEADEIGQVHARLQQLYRGLRVEGGELIVHLQGEQAVGVNGHFIPDLALSTRPGLAAEAALSLAERQLATRGTTPLSEPELIVFHSERAGPRLAWSRTDAYVAADGSSQQDTVFADANTGELLAHYSQIWSDKKRQVWDGTGYCTSSWYPPDLPGSLLFAEGWFPLPPDPAIQGAYAGTGKAWDFYKHVLGRDSYDGAGAPLVSSLHVTFDSPCHPNNAAWLTSKHQMVYGDGDGSEFGPLTEGVDVTAHELTHGVTEKTANLYYSEESGALNEALSDILGESVEAFQSCVSWRIGEDIYTPNVPNDALRYLNNPILDGKSMDHYHDLWTAGCQKAWALLDLPPAACDVHYTSGIGNLAFYLMSMGGTHPQGKTSVVVPGIGIDLASKIFYRALVSYMTPHTYFQDARKAMVQAAKAMFGSAALKPAILHSINTAWDAVGVPDTTNPGSFQAPPGGTLPPPTTSIEMLTNRSFESGAVVWSGTPGVVTDSPSQPAYDGNQPAYPGHWKAWLGGDGVASTKVLSQRVHIPAVAHTATLTFRLHVDTDEFVSVIRDTMRVTTFAGCGSYATPPDTLATYSNLDAAPGYVLKTVDLTPYKGQSRLITFSSSENASLQTSFVVDAVSLAVK